MTFVKFINQVKINKMVLRIINYQFILLQRRIKGPYVAPKEFYSTLRASAGFIPAALYAWKLTVTIAIKIAPTAIKANT